MLIAKQPKISGSTDPQVETRHPNQFWTYVLMFEEAILLNSVRKTSCVKAPGRVIGFPILSFSQNLRWFLPSRTWTSLSNSFTEGLDWVQGSSLGPSGGLSSPRLDSVWLRDLSSKSVWPAFFTLAEKSFIADFLFFWNRVSITRISRKHWGDSSFQAHSTFVSWPRRIQQSCFPSLFFRWIQFPLKTTFPSLQTETGLRSSSQGKAGPVSLFVWLFVCLFVYQTRSHVWSLVIW